MTTVNLAAYIRDLMCALIDDYAGCQDRLTLVVDLEPVLLPIDSAVSCGLRLNELLV